MALRDHHADARRAWVQQLQDDDAALRADLERKREQAIAYLKQRGKYILDQGSLRPNWGNACEAKPCN